MLTVGLDVHLRSSSLCILDSNGAVIKEQRVRGGVDRLLAELARLREPFQAVFEASCGYGPLHDRLSRIARRVVMAHPGQLRLIFRSRRKNDRVDARKLATLLLLDQVPAAHAPAPETRAWRGLIEHRRRLVGKRTRVKNGLRATLRSLAVSPPRGGGWLWTGAGRAWLAEVETPTRADALRRDTLLAELEHLDALVARVTAELDEIASLRPAVALLRTIPGVGPRTAEALAAYIDDPHRFRSSRCAGAYFGLVPSQDQSGGRNRLGRITRQGPATARGLLVEAAWQGIRRSDRLREVFERATRGERDRRKIALVAVAHHISRAALAMLRSGEAWRESE